MERTPFLIAHYPRHAIAIGKALLLTGGTLVLAAVFARSGMANINAERVKAGMAPVRSLVEAFPQYPAWLVPEGVVGFSFVAFMVVAGMTLTLLGEQAAKR